VAVTKEPGYKDGVVVDPRGAFLLYQSVTDNPFEKPAAAGTARAGAAPGSSAADREAEAGGAAEDWSSRRPSPSSTSRQERRQSWLERRRRYPPRLGAGLPQPER